MQADTRVCAVLRPPKKQSVERLSTPQKSATFFEESQHKHLHCTVSRSFGIYKTHKSFEKMATIDNDFKQVLDDFKKRLKPEEQTRFAMTTLVELQKVASDIQERQRRSKTAQNLTRIQPFLQAMSQYTEIIEVFLNTSSILCFVWGPMKFMLMVSLLRKRMIPRASLANLS